MAADYFWLKRQVQGLVGNFVSFYDSMYFDWMIIVENPDTPTTHFGVILEKLTRHGEHMSETQLSNIMSKIRARVQTTKMEATPIPWASSQIVRVHLMYTSGAADYPQVYEPNPLNMPDGMQPNATGFFKYF